MTTPMSRPLELAVSFSLVAWFASLPATPASAANGAVPFPFRAEDLPAGSVWRATNGHYDLSVRRFDEAEREWSKYRPGADPADDRAQDEMAYGIPVYSSFAGEVIDCWRNAPDNPPHRPHPARDGCNDQDGDGNVCDQNLTCSCRIPPGGNQSRARCTCTTIARCKRPGRIFRSPSIASGSRTFRAAAPTSTTPPG